MSLLRKTVTAAFALSLATAAQGATITTITIGDDDCFGLPGFTSCGDGDVNPSGIPAIGSYQNDLADLGNDTDIYARHDFTTGVELDFNVDLTGVDVLSAEVLVRVYSLDFGFGAISGSSSTVGGLIQWNGVTELIHNNNLDFATAREFTVNLDPMDLVNGVNTLAVIGDHIDNGNFTDDFAVDFATLTYTTELAAPPPPPPPPPPPTPAPVPLPAGGLLLLSAFGLLGWRLRNRG